jgi:hypothetical protein
MPYKEFPMKRTDVNVSVTVVETEVKMRNTPSHYRVKEWKPLSPSNQISIARG